MNLKTRLRYIYHRIFFPDYMGHYVCPSCHTFELSSVQPSRQLRHTIQTGPLTPSKEVLLCSSCEKQGLAIELEYWGIARLDPSAHWTTRALEKEATVLLKRMREKEPLDREIIRSMRRRLDDIALPLWRGNSEVAMRLIHLSTEIGFASCYYGIHDSSGPLGSSLGLYCGYCGDWLKPEKQQGDNLREYQRLLTERHPDLTADKIRWLLARHYPVDFNKLFPDNPVWKCDACGLETNEDLPRCSRCNDRPHCPQCHVSEPATMWRID